MVCLFLKIKQRKLLRSALLLEESKKKLLDASVGNALQLEPSRVSFMNAEWNSTLHDILCKVAREFGITSSVDCSLNKLLLFQEGASFKPRKNTKQKEKAFATLMIEVCFVKCSSSHAVSIVL